MTKSTSKRDDKEQPNQPKPPTRSEKVDDQNEVADDTNLYNRDEDMYNQDADILDIDPANQAGDNTESRKS